ncbi:MAG: hypothetical protein K8F91_25195 [Candidatus Obscuribacterales bacterium]|nr:hypothetical protein [Candidatus Obscuribacterales bacterium]
MNTFIGIGSDARYKDKVKEMLSTNDIPMRWRGTPIEHFVMAQNFGYPLHPSSKPAVLIVSCMEFRYSLPVPANYAYVIRTPGGRLIGAELAFGYVYAKGVRDILLIAHDDCGMTHLPEMAPQLIESFVIQGWTRQNAEKFVAAEIDRLAVKDELEALESEYHRLKGLFNNVNIAPLFLTLSDKRVYLPLWYDKFIASAGN